ncbi:MAG TPA: DUF4199 domain-containing protein [Gemmatimonadaceae bacterium]|nr:DUF4199 domain-containing protein [Gemmatimonadaceae bacterium]
MKRIVWTFGLIAGAFVSLMLAVSSQFIDEIGSAGVVIGFTTMVLAFLMVYMGIRQYRDQVAGGPIGFGRAFKVGILITLVTSLCYVATWELMYFQLTPQYGQLMAEAARKRIQTSDRPPAEIAAELRKSEAFMRRYQNPAFNAAITFTEIFPVGLVMTLVSAGILSRRRRGVPAAGLRAGLSA